MNTTTTQVQGNTLPSFINAAQAISLKAYNEGEFSHLLDAKKEEEFTTGYKDCGDGLLSFLMVELSTQEDCESIDVAVKRVSSALTQLQDVFNALEQA